MPQEHVVLTPSLSLEYLREQLGFNLRLACTTANKGFNDRLAKLKLTQRQCIALQLIGTNAGASQVDIAEVLGIDRSSMMAIADDLEKQKLISRRKSKKDGRRQEIRLTPHGKMVLRQARDLVRIHDSNLAKRFSKRELDALLANLRRIHARF